VKPVAGWKREDNLGRQDGSCHSFFAFFSQGVKAKVGRNLRNPAVTGHDGTAPRQITRRLIRNSPTTRPGEGEGSGVNSLTHSSFVIGWCSSIQAGQSIRASVTSR